MADTFRYFPRYDSQAEFSEKACDICGNKPALEGIYFGESVEADAVCVECLHTGRVTVEIPPYLKKRLGASIRELFPNLQDADVDARVEESARELSRTPPVPWIQHNYWPVCHGDFMRYLGEWDQAELSNQSPNGDGLLYLLKILVPFPRPAIGDPQALWQSIGRKTTAIYVFECLDCSKRIALAQSY